MENITYLADPVDFYTGLYKDNETGLKNGSPGFMNKVREDALQYFMKLGIPERKDENYKYTDLKSEFNQEYAHTLEPEDTPANIFEIFKCDVPSMDTHFMLTINGWYDKHNHPRGLEQQGVIVGSLKELASKHPEIIEKHYAKIADYTKEGTVALNTALAQDGFVIYIPKNTIIDKPIQIVNLLRSENDSYINQRNLIIAEEGSQAKIVLCDHTLSQVKFLTNNVTELYAAENTIVDLYNIQNQNALSSLANSVYIDQKATSNVLYNLVTLHGNLIRNNTYVKLDGEHCENHTLGIFFTDKEQHVDNFSFIHHAMPNCFSNELFRGILDDKSTGAFTGRILVEKDAQKTNAYQSNNNILLSDQAKVNSKPQLEIYADDVKCSHGATVGQLDENAMLYIRSRGINKKDARMMLMYAFAHAVVDQIRIEPLKERINELIEMRLQGDLSKCNACAIECGKDLA